jgi:transcription elongation GreA/GreB family factor
VSSIDKQRVLHVLRSRLTERLRDLTDSQKGVQAGAVHEETRAEDPKDTRATEASYLARGLAQRVGELESGVARLQILHPRRFGPDDAIALSALVGLKDEAGGCSVVFLVPGGAGETLSIDGQAIQPVTPGSPLGRALIGCRAGDEVEVELPGAIQQFAISWVA